MDNNLQSLYNQFLDVIEKGTEEEAKKFLVDHFRDFPGVVQKEIVFSFFAEGLEKVAGREKILTAERLVAEGIEALGRIRTKIEDQMKINDIKAKLDA